MRYDAAGNEFEPGDVLDAEELADFYAAQRDHRPAFRPPVSRIFPAVDEDGFDADGWAWGARDYGAAS